MQNDPSEEGCRAERVLHKRRFAEGPFKAYELVEFFFYLSRDIC